jgi:hypothetical protein
MGWIPLEYGRRMLGATPTASGTNQMRPTVFKATPPVVRQIIVVLLIWTGWFAAAPFMSREASGYCIVAHALIVAAAAISMLQGATSLHQQVGQRAAFAFGLAYLLWAAADFCWAINYFIAPSSSKETLGIVVTLLCAASFTLCSAAILLAVDGSVRRFLDARLSAVAVAVTTAVFLAMLLYPYVNDPAQEPLSLFGGSEFLAILAGYICAALAIVVLLASRTLEWSVHGAGLMCWIFGDSAIRIGKILNDSIDVDGYSVLCSFGLYASLLPLLSRRPKERIDAVDFGSLFTSCKFGSTITIFLCLMAFLLSQGGDLNAVRVITLCCGLASFGSIFLSSFIVTKVKSLSVALAAVLEGDIRKEAETSPDVSDCRSNSAIITGTSSRPSSENARSMNGSACWRTGTKCCARWLTISCHRSPRSTLSSPTSPFSPKSAA